MQNRGYLDFNDFRRFVKLLKGRPDVQRLYNKLKARNNEVFDVKAFQDFMRKEQGVRFVCIFHSPQLTRLSLN